MIKELGAVVLSLWASQPANIDSALLENPYKYYSATTGCPTLRQANHMLPKYGIQNMVAEFKAELYDVMEFGHNEIRITYHFLTLFYNSKAAISDKFVPKGYADFIGFMKGNSFDIVEIYETELLKPKNKPTSVIFRDGTKTYVFLDLKGGENSPDGIFDTVFCFTGWSPQLMRQFIGYIIDERNRRKFKKTPLPPLPRPNNAEEPITAKNPAANFISYN